LLLALLVGRGQAHELDAQGQQMLSPLREQTLHPTELIARLHLRRSDVVADVGAGPGFLTLQLARAVSRVIATDIREQYLAVLTQRAREAGVTNIETRVVAADQPGLERASIDVALVCQVDHYLRDRTSFFAALKTALRPGGRIVLVNYERYHAADTEAARAVKLRPVEEWAPSPPFFVMVLTAD
jgi:2-polyprenyl-3-methyl-5-hydroxy-6-metoxy-1,4-benzoquinol methylase